MSSISIALERMTIGFVYIAKLATELEAVTGDREAEKHEGEFEVKNIARFAMSPDAFARLTENAQHIFTAMVETGHIKIDKDEGES